MGSWGGEKDGEKKIDGCVNKKTNMKTKDTSTSLSHTRPIAAVNPCASAWLAYDRTAADADLEHFV